MSTTGYFWSASKDPMNPMFTRSERDAISGFTLKRSRSTDSLTLSRTLTFHVPIYLDDNGPMTVGIQYGCYPGMFRSHGTSPCYSGTSLCPIESAHHNRNAELLSSKNMMFRCSTVWKWCVLLSLADCKRCRCVCAFLKRGLKKSLIIEYVHFEIPMKICCVHWIHIFRIWCRGGFGGILLCLSYNRFWCDSWLPTRPLPYRSHRRRYSQRYLCDAKRGRYCMKSNY